MTLASNLVHPAGFDRLARGFADYSYLQWPPCADAAAAHAGARCEYVAFGATEAAPVALVAVRVKTAGPAPFGLAYVNAGPILAAGAAQRRRRRCAWRVSPRSAGAMRAAG